MIPENIIKGAAQYVNVVHGASVLVPHCPSSPSLVDALRRLYKGHARIDEIENLVSAPQEYDAVFMAPPPGEEVLDFAQVSRAMVWLKPGGRVVAILERKPESNLGRITEVGGTPFYLVVNERVAG